MTAQRPCARYASRRRLAGAILALELTVGWVSAQSLGEVARQEEARRKTVKPPGKVYTNGTLKSEPTLPVASTPAQPNTPQAGASGPSTQAPSATTHADPAKDEQSWRKRIQSEREALDRAQTYAAALQSRISSLSADFVNRDDPAQRNTIAADRQKALNEYERLKQEIQQHTKALADIQEEGRRAGVPSGWLR